MARKHFFRGNPNPETNYSWAFEECEETVFVAAYEEIVPLIAPDERWRFAFEDHFYRRGDWAAIININNINVVRRRNGLPLVQFEETHVYDYGRELDRSVVVQRRCRLRDELAAMDDVTRARHLDACRAAIKRLPQPDIPAADRMKMREKREAENAASFEAAKRRAAVEAEKERQAAAEQKKLDVETAAELLRLADDPEDQDEIIARVPEAELIDLAKKVENAEVRKKIIRHRLGKT
jgi:hypothetical protein